MKNEFFIRKWMEKYDINDLAWRKSIIDGKDPFSLFTDAPQIEEATTLQDDYDLSPLYYYCFVATPTQLEKLLRIIPERIWLESKPSPLRLVILGGNFDTIKYMFDWLANPFSGALASRLFDYFREPTYFESEWECFALCLMRSGHSQAVKWFLSNNFPENLKNIRFARSGTIIADLFCSGNLELMQWALSAEFPSEFKPYLQSLKVCLNIARSGNAAAILWMFSNDFPASLRSFLERDLSCRGAYLDFDRWEQKPSFGEARSYVSFSGPFSAFAIRILINADIRIIQYIFEEKRFESVKKAILKNQKNNMFSYLAITSSFGCDRLFQNSASERLPIVFRNMLLQRDKNGNTFLQNLAYRDVRQHHNRAGVILYTLGHRKSLYHFLTQQPELAAFMWLAANKNNDAIDWYESHIIGRKNTRIAAVNLLKQIILAAFIRISEAYPVIVDIDLRLLRAFKQKAVHFLKDSSFINRTILVKLIESGAMQTIFGVLTDKNLKIIFQFFRYHDRSRLQLSAALLDELLLDLSPKDKSPNLGLFSAASADPFAELINCLKKIRDVLRDNAAHNIQRAAVLLKLYLLDKKFEERLCEDNQHLLVALRNILLRTDEISALMPSQSESRGNVIAESGFKKELDGIESLLRITTNAENSDSALMVLNGIRYLLPHFDDLNAFSKAHPGKLYYLDTPGQLEPRDGKLPFHLEEYGIDEELRDTLLRIVREYIAVFLLSKSVGRLPEFFDMTTKGYCLDARVRDLGTWATKFIGLEDFDTLMKKYITEYHAKICIMDNIHSPHNIDHFVEPVSKFILHYHLGDLFIRRTLESAAAAVGHTEEHVVEEVTALVVERYLVDVLAYNRQAEPAGKTMNASRCCSLM